jgi:cytochrome c oxidase assembly protein subunit 15
LGGLRVRWNLDKLGIPHATLAQLFFVLVGLIALMTSERWQKLSQLSIYGHKSLRYLFLLTTVTILFQLILGATMRHQHAGLAIPDFPAAYGKLWPALDAASVASYNQNRLEVVAYNPITALQIGLQMAHRLTALGIFFLVSVCVWRSRQWLGRNHALTKLSFGWLGLIVAQMVLGAATIWTNKSADMATAHVAVGALSLATGSLMTLVAFRSSVTAKAAFPVQATDGSEFQSITRGRSPREVPCS